MSKAVNWPAIKKRYLQGEKPKKIAADYDLTAKQISDKASKDKWTRKKAEIVEKVAVKVENELDALRRKVLDEYQRVAFSDIRDLMKWDGQDITLKDSSKISADAALTVSEVGHVKGGIKLKLHNKLAALDALAAYTGINKPVSKEGDTSQLDELARVIQGSD